MAEFDAICAGAHGYPVQTETKYSDNVDIVATREEFSGEYGLR